MLWSYDLSEKKMGSGFALGRLKGVVRKMAIDQIQKLWLGSWAGFVKISYSLFNLLRLYTCIWHDLQENYGGSACVTTPEVFSTKHRFLTKQLWQCFFVLHDWSQAAMSRFQNSTYIDALRKETRLPNDVKTIAKQTEPFPNSSVAFLILVFCLTSNFQKCS